MLLSACAPQSGGRYAWGWHVIDPFLPQGWVNMRFLLLGLFATLAVSLVSICISVTVGALVALCAFSRWKGVLAFNRLYVEVVRAVPLLVLILWVYYGLPVVSGVQFGIFVSGVISLSLSDSAFQAEIFRGGIQAVPKGQSEAARAIGLTGWQTLRLVVLPQAVRAILPALGNQFVYMLKMSSLLMVIGFQELTRRANELTTTENRPLEIYTFLVLEYLVLILIASWAVRRLEKRLNRGFK